MKPTFPPVEWCRRQAQAAEQRADPAARQHYQAMQALWQQRQTPPIPKKATE